MITTVHVYRTARYNRHATVQDRNVYELTFTYRLNHDEPMTLEDVANFFFDATNNPTHDQEMEHPMFDAEPTEAVKLLKEWRKCQQCSLSVSDRINVGKDVLECDSFGWLAMKCEA